MGFVEDTVAFPAKNLENQSTPDKFTGTSLVMVYSDPE